MKDAEQAVSDQLRSVARHGERIYPDDGVAVGRID